MMRTQSHDPLTPSDGGAAPPISPLLPALDEGPMRAELLRQIRRLEIETSRFAAANCPYDPVPVSPRRGPAILTTAQLEAIRDELLVVRTTMHELVVERLTARVAQPKPAKPTMRQRLKGLRRRGA